MPGGGLAVRARLAITTTARATTEIGMVEHRAERMAEPNNQVRRLHGWNRTLRRRVAGEWPPGKRMQKQFLRRASSWLDVGIDSL